MYAILYTDTKNFFLRRSIRWKRVTVIRKMVRPLTGDGRPLITALTDKIDNSSVVENTLLLLWFAVISFDVFFLKYNIVHSSRSSLNYFYFSFTNHLLGFWTSIGFFSLIVVVTFQLSDARAYWSISNVQTVVTISLDIIIFVVVPWPSESPPNDGCHTSGGWCSSMDPIENVRRPL